MPRTITIRSMPYSIETASDGSESWAVYSQDEPDTEVFEVVADEFNSVETIAAGILRDHGTTQNEGFWFSDPDPDATMDFRTGEYTEYAATLDGFTDAELTTISNLV